MTAANESASSPSPSRSYSPDDELNIHLKGKASVIGVSQQQNGSRHTGWSGSHTAQRVVPTPSIYSQQSVVVVELVGKGAMRSGAKTTVMQHASYLQEEKEQEKRAEKEKEQVRAIEREEVQNRAVMFDAKQDRVRTMHDMAMERSSLPADDKVGRQALRDEMNRSWELKVNGERHHFRVIVSPKNSHQMDMEKHVRDLMAQAEKDQGTKLDWRATIHRDTKQVHAQIILRGKRDDGRTLYLDKQYISHGLRHRSQELATKELGLRHLTKDVAAMERAMEQERQMKLRTLSQEQNKGKGQETGMAQEMTP